MQGLPIARDFFREWGEPFLRREFPAWTGRVAAGRLLGSDVLGVQMGLGQFVEEAMRLCFLLNGDFSPYWKWLAFEFRKLPEARTLDPLLVRLVGARDRAEQVALVLAVSRLLHDRLLAEGLITPPREDSLLLPLLDAHGEIIGKIDDEFWR